MTFSLRQKIEYETIRIAVTLWLVASVIIGIQSFLTAQQEQEKGQAALKMYQDIHVPEDQDADHLPLSDAASMIADDFVIEKLASVIEEPSVLDRMLHVLDAPVRFYSLQTMSLDWRSPRVIEAEQRKYPKGALLQRLEGLAVLLTGVCIILCARYLMRRAGKSIL